MGRDAYAAREMMFYAYAVLNLDGEWRERERYVATGPGFMDGRFEHESDWPRRIAAAIRELPDDGWLAVIDVHR